MTLTEREIFQQYPALGKTYQYLLKKSDEIRKFFQKRKDKSLTFIGCGSSYFQCRSAEISARQRLMIPANSIAAAECDQELYLAAVGGEGGIKRGEFTGGGGKNESKG